MATYRERREARAERLREWADKHDATADALYARGDPYRGDIAFNTQPGHIPERAGIIRATEKSFEERGIADKMSSRAAGIEDQLARSIYSDDPDAAEQIEAKLATLEAEHARRKEINRVIRKSGMAAAESLMTERDKADLVMIAQVQAYYDPLHKGFPNYDTTNRNANIRAYRQRLEALRDPKPHRVVARHPGTCPACSLPIEPDTVIAKVPGGEWVHDGCVAVSA